MAILAGDIKLVKSQVMLDTPEGGGAPTAEIIEDAVSNSIFPDISELDRAGGRVNLRKIHATVQTPTTDGYYGANMIVAEPPQDPNVSVTLAKGTTFDRRAEVASRITAYLNIGPSYSAYLYEDHIAGQRSIQLFTRVGVDGPPVGRTLVLMHTATSAEQYVRVTRVTSELRTFTYAGGSGPADYTATILTLDLSDALLYDFPGSPASPLFAPAPNKTVVRDTVVADAATYYGVVPLAEAGAIGDVSVKASRVYSQLVPNSRTETPIADRKPASDTALTVATSPFKVDVIGSSLSQRIRIGQENRGYSYVTILSPLPAPNSLRISYRALGQNYTVQDDGAGRLTGSGSGTVSYTTGSVVLTLDAMPDDRSAIVFYWGQTVAYTNRSGALDFRPPEYAFDLDKVGIVPGSLSITWDSGSITRTATANSQGVISGDAVGEVCYTSARIYLRPLYMIDAGGEFSLSYQWSDIIEQSITSLSPDASGAVTFTLSHSPVPGTVECHWLTSRETSITGGSNATNGSTTKSNSNGTNNSVVSTTRTVTSYPFLLDVIVSENLYSTSAGGSPGGSVIPAVPDYNRPVLTEVTDRKNVYSTFQKDASSSATYATSSVQRSKTSVAVEHVVTDNGSGNFFGGLGIIGYVSKSVTLQVVGDYVETSYEQNYESGSTFASLNATGEPTTTLGGPAPTVTQGGGGSSSSKGGGYGSTSNKEVFSGAAGVLVRYKTGTASPASHTQTYAPPGVVIDIAPRTKDYLIPGSIQFTWMGHTYRDFEGVLYRDRTDSAAGTASGYVNYYTGMVGLYDYIVGASPNAITINSMWSTRLSPRISNIVFNLALSPAKSGSLIMSVTDITGANIIATTDTSGNITGTHTRGKADFESGLVEVQFGDWVAVSSLTDAQKAEWWFNPLDERVADGKIFKPWPVDPTTLRYAVVAYSYLPLDASILGLDPVRLPTDGRVPIFKPGDFAVMGHSATVGPNTVSNGQTINCGRVRLSRVRVIGNDGSVINSGYSANLEAGTVTFTNVTGYSQPVTIEHRVEDMAVVRDVQINGTIGFTRPLTHDYPLGSYLSSALVVGDLTARVSTLFDQATWTNVWSDSLIGSSASGTYNDVLSPLEVTNVGALTERWAIRFTNTTAFEVIGEHVGVIATGNTSSDLSPINPATGQPYFTLRAIGWGSGWSTNNVLRFNTVGCQFPVWVVRTVQQGPETVINDSFTLLTRGDVDRP